MTEGERGWFSATPHPAFGHLLPQGEKDYASMSAFIRASRATAFSA